MSAGHAIEPERLQWLMASQAKEMADEIDGLLEAARREGDRAMPIHDGAVGDVRKRRTEPQICARCGHSARICWCRAYRRAES